MSKPVIYIVNDSNLKERFDNVDIFSVKKLNDIGTISDSDFILYHFGRVPSETINKEDLGDSPNLQRTICFSRGGSIQNTWDIFVKTKMINSEKSDHLDLNGLEVELKNFQFNLNRNRKKTLFRLTVASFLKKDKLISNKFTVSTSIDSLYTGIFESEHIYKTYIETEDNNLLTLIPPIKQLPAYFSNLVTVCEKILESLANDNIEIIPHTLFFRPSPILWKYLEEVKDKIYVFLICPWRAYNKFNKIQEEGFNVKRHKNIVLWNPMDGVETLKTLIYKTSTIETNTKSIDIVEIKNSIFSKKDNTKFSEIDDAKFSEIDDAKFTELSELIYQTKYLQHSLNDLFENTNSNFKALLLLDVLGNNYDQHTHESNRTDSPFDSDYSIKQQIFILRQRCSDALESLSVLKKFEKTQGPIIIDLIDDKSEEDIDVGGYKLQDILKLFLKDKYIANPPIQPSEKNFNAILKYNSISKQNSNDIDIGISPNCEIILTDLLYKFDRKQGEKSSTYSYSINDGIKFISGLNRIIRDKKNNISQKLPSIIAFSQDTNPKTITSAIKVGAKDYVFKSRPFFLPAAIIKAKLTTGDQTTTYHRNFRSTYNFSNEVIGLLQSNIIHKTDRALVEKILKAIPKTDLHVHVGSCMDKEFLVLASFISLLRLDFIDIKELFSITTPIFENLVKNGTKQKFRLPYFNKGFDFTSTDKHWVEELSSKVKIKLLDIIKDNKTEKDNPIESKRIKSFFHKNFNIPDYFDNNRLRSRIENLSNFDLAFYTIQNSIELNCKFVKFDLVRLYLLFLTTKYKSAKLVYKSKNLLNILFNNKFDDERELYNELNSLLFVGGDFSVNKFRNRGWLLKNENTLFNIELQPRGVNIHEFEHDPISYILATGTRSNDLVEYLEGCEYSGAEHLQHPFLIHLYTRQAISKFIEYGICYTELRGSPSGYVNKEIGFGFTDVMNCLMTAFNEAQDEVKNIFYGEQKNNHDYIWNTFSFTKNIKKYNVPNNLFLKRLPCKVNLIITGKRHKSLREMILEAAMAASMRRNNVNSLINSGEFSEKSLYNTEVVGFDLAGKEEGNPPEKFIEEFARLSKLHIPLTIHAGENASSEFIESAVLKVGARRIGHGLALAEDEQLMNRLREQRVCIELCPVCNHQTSHFEGKQGRRYPLAEYLKAGLLVCINTDNPIISDTNIVKEYIKASETMVNKELSILGLSMWDALRIIRMGFVSSFLTLQERKYFMEVVDQHLFDFFNNTEVIENLYKLPQSTKNK